MEFATYFVFEFVDVCGCVKDRGGQIPMVCQLVQLAYTETAWLKTVNLGLKFVHFYERSKRARILTDCVEVKQ